ncbi:peroxisomal N(1)-acetyl-spermine/spermidine oxidase-like isoform X2 [Stegostoma tigrinum]|nr:peroxisomal N(1)-acetyl-spermine/spermidine oxidase-like isoform X2 [Stegostoma tigrinum]
MKNPIFQLAKEYGLLQEVYNKSDGKWSVLTNTQKQFDDDFVKEMENLTNFLWEQTTLRSQGREYAELRSIGQVYLEEIKKVLSNWTDDSPKFRRQKLGFLNMMKKNLCLYFSSQNLNDVSLQEFSEYEDINGGDLNSPRLFLKLISNLVEEIPREKLLLQKPVKHIQWNGSFESETGKLYPVRVVCEDGDHILADHVIVTVSLGYLKEAAEALFQPSLPADKLHAIRNMGFGTTNKIYLEYEVPFWNSSEHWIELVWEDETPFSGLKPNLAEWWRRIFALDVLHPVERYGHILLGWSSGREAEFIETLSEEDLVSNITRILRQFTGRPVPQPKNAFVTKWFSNPYTRGSYSHISINSTGDMIDTLAEPLPQEGDDGHLSEMMQVLFAGEATHRTYHSTTHGALLSGWREADRLINLYSTSEEQHQTNNMNSKKKIPKVVIIGAGIAGVAAAGKLLQHGFNDVQIIEASSRPGGRIRSYPFGKSLVDEGAQYIHGASMKNPIFQLAKEYGFLQEVYNKSGTEWSLLTNTQKQLDPDFAEEMRNLASSILRHAHCLAEEKGYTQAKSLADVYLEEIKTLLEQWSDEHVELRRQRLALLSMSMKWQCIHLATNSLGDVSVLEYGEYKSIEGDDRNSPGLFPRLLQKLLEVIPKEKLLLERPVKQIQWDGNFELEDTSQYPVRVVCKDGTHILADHVIITISLGCLKANSQSLFQPSLPENYQHAIQAMGFGTMNKIYLEYEAPFWDENTDIIGLVWEDETPLSAQKPNLVEWWRCVPVVYVFRPPERYGHVLVGTITGKEAEFVESLSPEEIASNFTKLFRQFTGRPSLPAPKNVFVTKWSSNPYTRGSYSHISINSTGDMIDTLAEPLPQAKEGIPSPMMQILFAGEATHRSSHSTTHGALLSGWREADRLINHYSTK